MNTNIGRESVDRSWGGRMGRVLVLAAAGGVSAGAWAEPPTGFDPRDPVMGLDGPVDTQAYFEPTDEALEVYAGVDVVSQYVDRGVVQSNKGSLQPWVEVHLSLPDRERDVYERAQGLANPRFFVGSFNSLQSGDPGLGQLQDGRVRNWYEANVYGGVSMVFAEVLTASLRYSYYTSPGNSFDDFHELDARLRFNDARYWSSQWEQEGFATFPTLQVAQELDGGEGRREGTFIQIGATPTVTLDEPATAITLEVPLAVGLGGSGQFVDAEGESQRFGYFRTGLGMSVPIDVVPEDAGVLRLRAGVDAFLADDSAFTGTGDRELLVGRLGLDFEF